MDIINNKTNGQFEYRTADYQALLTYRMRDKTMYLMHTKVPDELSGKGIASTLAKKALEFAKSNNYKIAVLCPFVTNYVKKHSEWYDLYDRDYHKQIDN